MSNTFKYSIDIGEYSRAHEITTTYSYDMDDSWDLESIAEECANDFLFNHDGYEYKDWVNGGEPLRVLLWIDENTHKKFDVSVEYEPTFEAYCVDDEE